METYAEYIARLKKQEQERNAAAAGIVVSTTEGSPDEIAGDMRLAQEYAKTTGKPQPPVDMVTENRSVFQQEVEQRKTQTLLGSNPRLAEWLRDPKNAAISKDRLDELSFFEQWVAQPFRTAAEEITMSNPASRAVSRGAARITAVDDIFSGQISANIANDIGKTVEQLYQEQLAKVGGDQAGLDQQGLALRYAQDRYDFISGLSEEDRAELLEQSRVAFETARGIIDRAQSISMSDTATRFRDVGLANAENSIGGFFGAVAEDPAGAVAFILETAAESIPMLAVSTAATAVGGPVAGAATMGATSFAVENTTEVDQFFREKGVDFSDPQAAYTILQNPEIMREAQSRGLTRGLIIGLLDGISGGVAGQTLSKSPIGNMLLQSLAQAALGSGGEALAQAANGDELTWADIIIEGLAELSTAPLEVAGVGGAMFADRAQRAEEARLRQERLQGFVDQAVNAKVRERAPDAFRDYLTRTLDGKDAETMYVPADKFTEYFQSVGLNVEEVISQLDGVDPNQVAEAVATGGDIAIPTATFAAKIAGSEHDAFLLQNSRFSPEDMTFAEAEEWEATKATLLDEAMQQAETIRAQAEVEIAAGQQIYDAMSERLVQAGRAEGVARQEAALWRSMYETQSARSGVPVAELMARYPLPEIRGPGQQAQAQQADPTEGGLYDQTGRAVVDSEPFKQWFGNSAVVDESGAPMVVYHGTGGRTGIEAFDPAAIGSRDAGFYGEGFYFTPDDEDADSYASDDDGNYGEVMPVYLSLQNPFVWDASTEEAKVKTSEALAALGIKRSPDQVSATDTDALSNADERRRFNSAVRAAGYDGVIVKNEYRVREIVAFDPTQIKSVSNRGNFDATDPNIYNQTATIRRGQETLQKFGLDPNGRYTAREVATALEARQRKKYGTIERGDYSDKASRRIAQWMVEEVMFEVEQAEANPMRSAVGWYSTKFQSALDALGAAFPEFIGQPDTSLPGVAILGNKQNARDFFTALMAITSDGAKVADNFRFAAGAYETFRQTGRIDTEITFGGERNLSMRINLANIQRVLDERGADAMASFLLTKDTVSNLKKMAKAEGMEFSSAYKAKMELPYAALVFGPKLGAFYANLMGDTGYLTMDRWWSRTFNRYRGTLLQQPTEAGLTRFKELVTEDQRRNSPASEMTDDEAIALTVDYVRSYKAKGYKNGTEIEKAANTIYKAAFEGLEDQPFNASDREFMIDTAVRAQKALKRRGVDLTVADLQAVLWYYEKRLYGELGARQTQDISYEEIARNVVASRNDPDAGTDQEAGGSGYLNVAAAEEAESDGPVADPVDPEYDASGAEYGQEAVGAAGAGGYAGGGLAPLPGAPTVAGASGPDPRLVAVAEQYAADNGIPLKRQAEFVEVDPERAARIAAAYEAMPHAPQDPAVKEAYQNLIQQTLAQYQALVDAGYQFYFFDDTNDPYGGNPWNAMRDLRANQRMAVYATEAGFGSGDTELNVDDNPMLADTGLMWGYGSPDGEQKRVLANDLFRAVHDAFGHGLEGAGFRARGEENAWQAHVRLFTGSAVAAITTETRGQNSWLNYGPYGEKNRTASVEETVFADQKTGLLPEWTWTEGRAADEDAVDLSAPVAEADLQKIDANFLRRPGWVIFSATRGDLGPWDSDANRAAADEARGWMQRADVPFVEIMGRYEGVDDGPSFIAIADERDAKMIARKFGQDSVLTKDGLIGGTTDFAPVPSTGEVRFGTPQELEGDYFSILPDGRAFTMGLNFDYKLDLARIPEGMTQRADRPQLPIRADGKVELVHWSNRRRTTIDPAKAGTGPLEGPERRRGVQMSFFGINPREATSEPGTGYVKEGGLGPWRHTVAVDPDALYPWFEDPDGLKQSLSPDDRNNVTAYEDLIREAGYIGYYTTENGQGSAPLGNVAALFGPAPVESVVDERMAAREYGQGAVIDVGGVTLPLNPDGTVTLYHGTTAEAAQEIIRTGSLRSAAEPSVYLTTAQQGTGYGDGTVVSVDVMPSSLRLDDEFPDGRADFAIDRRFVRVSNPRPAAPALLFQNNRGSIMFPSGGIGKGQTIVNLFQGADLSTFVHESGHFFLSMLQDMAARGETSAQQEYEIIKAWWGSNADAVAKDASRVTGVAVTAEDVANALANGTSGDPAKDNAIDVGMQEQWARAFEAYLMEGKAPSVELRGAFERFRAWLMSVYRSLTSLNVKTSPELKGVFDRMLATDEQIAEARKRDDSLGPMFKTAADMGLSEQEYQKYKTLAMQAEDDAKATLLGEIMDPIRRAAMAAFKAERAKAVERITAEKKKLPIYRAIQEMRFGQTFEGDETPGIKLNRKALEDGYGADILSRLPGSTKAGKGHRWAVYATGDGGMHPDVVAEMYGFSTGRELVDALLSTPPLEEAVEADADAYMANRTPDPLRDGTAQQKALDALKNDKKARLIAMELAALNQKLEADRGLRSKLLFPKVSQFREMARRALSPMSIKDARAAQRYVAASKKAAEEAYRAVAKGDIRTAAEAKRRHLLAHMMYMEARKIDAKVEQLVNRLSKLNRADSTQSKKIDVDHVRAARAIASKFGLANADGQFDFDAWVAQLQFDDPATAATLTHAIQTYAQQSKPFKALTVGEFMAVVDAVENLIETGRSVRLLEIEGQKMAKDAVVAELIDVLNDRGIKQNPALKARLTAAQRMGKSALSMLSALRRVEAWARDMDDGKQGPFTRYLVRPVMDALGVYRDERSKRLDQMLAIINPRRKDLLSGGAIPAPELGYTFETKAELIHAILHTGNESNKEKLLIGRGWSSGMVDQKQKVTPTGKPSVDRKGNPIMDRGTVDTSQWDAFIARMAKEGKLTKEDFDMAQSIWDLMEELKRPAQSAHRKMFGFYFSEIETSPVFTPFGTYRGGYVPAIADQDASNDGQIRADQNALEMQQTSFMFPTTGSGFTKSRVEQYRTPLALDLMLLPAHMDKVLRFTHLEPVIRQTAGIISSRDMRETMDAYDQSLISSMLTPWLQRTAQQAVEQRATTPAGRAFSNIARELRRRVGIHTMFMNVVNTAQQITGFSTAAVLVKPYRLSAALSRYTAGGAFQMRAEALSMSAFMRDRVGQAGRETQRRIQEAVVKPTVPSELRALIDKHGYVLQQFTQNIMDIIIWHAAYDQAIAKKMSEADAVFEADSVIRRTIGDFAPENLSLFETGNAFTRLFTMFYSYFNGQANLVGGEMKTAMRTMGWRGSPKMFWIYLMGIAAPAIVADLIVRGFQGDWPEDEDDDGYADEIAAMTLGAQGRYIAAMIPVAGQVTMAMMNRFNDMVYDDRLSTSPVVSTVERASGAPAAIAKAVQTGEGERRAVMDGLTLLALITGVPMGQLAKMTGYAMDVSSGEAQPQGAADVVQGLTSGKDGTKE